MSTGGGAVALHRWRNRAAEWNTEQSSIRVHFDVARSSGNLAANLAPLSHMLGRGILAPKLLSLKSYLNVNSDDKSDDLGLSLTA